MKIANKILLLLLVSFSIIEVASADGWHLSDQQVHLLEPNQKAIISWDGKNETMILSSAVKSDEIANFAWIIPIQSSIKPEVMAGNISVFEDLVEYFTEEKQKDTGVTGRVTPVAIPGVVVVESKEVDVYDITILKATSSDDLISWLINNRFETPEEAKPILDKYVAKGDYYFIANKIDLTNKFNEDVVKRYNWLMEKGQFDNYSGKYAQEFLIERTYNFPIFKKILSYNILCNEDFSVKIDYATDYFEPVKPSYLEKLGISNYKYIVLNTVYGINDGFCNSLLDFKSKHLNYIHPPYEDVSFPNEEIKKRYDLIYKEVSLILDPIQEYHYIRYDLKNGISTPLKFEFQPHQPYYPLEISSLNMGDSNIEVYVLTDRNVIDKNGMLKVDEFKVIDSELRKKLEKHINLTLAQYVTRLFYKGDFGDLAVDAEFTTGQPTTFAVPNKTSDAIAETPKQTSIEKTSGFEIVLAMTILLLITMIRRKRNQIPESCA